VQLLLFLKGLQLFALFPSTFRERRSYFSLLLLAEACPPSFLRKEGLHFFPFYLPSNLLRVYLLQGSPHRHPLSSLNTPEKMTFVSFRPTTSSRQEKSAPPLLGPHQWRNVRVTKWSSSFCRLLTFHPSSVTFAETPTVFLPPKAMTTRPFSLFSPASSS